MGWPRAAVREPGRRVAKLRTATPCEKRRRVEYGVVLTTDYAYVADLRGIGTARAVVFPITDQMARAVCVYGCPRGYDLYSAGWPAHCVAGFVQDDHPRKETHEYLDVIRVGPYGDGSFRQVPYRQMWLGLMVNTLFYAALPGLPAVVRRLVRVRPGWCQGRVSRAGSAPRRPAGPCRASRKRRRICRRRTRPTLRR